MVASVVQTLSRQQAYSQSFAADVTTGNSIVVGMSGFTTAGAAISSSAPTFNGLAVTGATKAVSVQSAGGSAVYLVLWLLPNVTGGTGVKGPIASTLTNGGTATAVGITAWECAGLGATPSIDVFSSGSGTTGTALSSGTTGATASAGEILFAIAASFGNPVAMIGAPWTETGTGGGADTQSGFQVLTSAGGTFSYAPTASGPASWGAVIASVQGSGGGAPSFTGASTATVAFSGTATGSKRVAGASTASVATAATAVGAKRSAGASAASVAFTASAAGAKRSTGSSTATVAFGASVAGAKRVARAVSAVLGLGSFVTIPAQGSALDESELSAAITTDYYSAAVTADHYSAEIS